MDLHPRRRGLVAQVAEPAGLVAGEVLRDVAAGGEPDGVLVVGLLGRRLDLDDVEVGLAVVGVEAQVLEHARRARVVLGGARPGDQIGRASCRERVWQYVLVPVVDIPLQKQPKSWETNDMTN